MTNYVFIWLVLLAHSLGHSFKSWAIGALCSSTHLSSAELNWTQFSWTQLNSIQLNSTHQNSAELNSVGLELNSDHKLNLAALSSPKTQGGCNIPSAHSPACGCCWFIFSTIYDCAALHTALTARGEVVTNYKLRQTNLLTSYLLATYYKLGS